MSNARIRCLAALLAIAAVEPLAAQQLALSRAHGASRLDGAIAAGGPGWSARLDAESVLVRPALGARAERAQGLELALESVRRGAFASAPAAARVEPRLEGERAIYARADGLTELYEVRAEGLEQSFVFARPPAGDGDLIVRLAAASALEWPASSAWSSALVFRHAGQPALEISGVLGIDAQGRRAAGELRALAGAIELRLPADFVASASYPLLLDPLIGVNSALASAGDASQPALAYHPGLGQYLAVWQVELSLASAEIRAQRLDAAGAPLGSMLTIDAGANVYSAAPVVGIQRDKGAFLVAYQQAPFFAGPFDIAARAVASNDAVSSELLVASQAADESEPTLGSEAAAGQGDACLLLWTQAGAGLRGARIAPDTFGQPSLAGSIAIPGTSALDDHPALAHSGGAAGVFLAVYRARSLVIEDALRALVIRRDGSVLGSPAGVLVPGRDIVRGATDGYPLAEANARWLVAAELTEAADPSSHDVQAWSFGWNGSALAPLAGPVALASGVGDDEIEPAVLWMGNKGFVAWADESPGLDYDLLLKGLDPAKCTTCENQLTIATGSGLNRTPALAGELPSSGGAAAAKGLIAWSQIEASLPFDGDIWMRRLQATAAGGTTQDLGGGCGAGGAAGVGDNPALGTGDFAFTLSGADPAAPFALMNLGLPGASPLSCGSCQLEPYVITLGRPLTAGSASFPLAIPCDLAALGAKFVLQWTVVLTSSSPCALASNVALSNRLEITLGP